MENVGKIYYSNILLGTLRQLPNILVFDCGDIIKHARHNYVANRFF